MITGDTIRGWRRERGLEAQFVAKGAGLNKQQFSDIERGKRQIEVNEFVAIMKAMGYKPGDVLENSGAVPENLKPSVEVLQRIRPAVLGRVPELLRAIDGIAEDAERSAASNVVQFPVTTAPHVTPEFEVDPDEFIEGDFDYPRILHATKWEEDFEVAAGEEGGTETDMTAHTVHTSDVYDTTHRTIRVKGRSMHPDYEEGWMLLVDLKKISPQPGDPVAVYIEGRGSVLGYWTPTTDGLLLEKANPSSKPVRLNGTWRLIGTIQKIVDAPARKRRRS